MYDFPVHDLHSGTKRKSILFFHFSTKQMATSTILTWRHTSPLYKPFTCICVLKLFRPQYPQTDTSIKHFPLGEHFSNSLFLSMYRKLMMSPLAMFLTSGELVTTYDRKGSGHVKRHVCWPSWWPSRRSQEDFWSYFVLSFSIDKANWDLTLKFQVTFLPFFPTKLWVKHAIWAPINSKMIDNEKVSFEKTSSVGLKAKLWLRQEIWYKQLTTWHTNRSSLSWEGLGCVMVREHWQFWF